MTTFIHAEDENFSLFNYVNDLTNEIEKMENSIADVREEIKKYRGQGLLGSSLVCSQSVKAVHVAVIAQR